MNISAQTQSLADAWPTFRTGDLLIFMGNSSDPIDWAIQFIEGEPYTHVGMILQLDGQLYFWDAPGRGETFPDPIKGHPHTGCRVAPLEQVLKYYMQSEVALYYRQLAPAPTPDQLAAMMIFIKAADGLPFPLQAPDWIDGLNLGLGLVWSYGLGTILELTQAGAFFCAHLVAETYMRMGLMKIAPYPANAYSPADFTENNLPLVNCKLGPVVKLEGPVPSGSAVPVLRAPLADVTVQT